MLSFDNKVGVRGERNPADPEAQASLRIPASLFLRFAAASEPGQSQQTDALLAGARPAALPRLTQLSLQAALAESSRLKQQLTVLPLKTDLLGSVFGQDKAAALLEQVAGSVRDRDLLHNSLLQRKSKLQVSAAAVGPRALRTPPSRGAAALALEPQHVHCAALCPNLELLVCQLGGDCVAVLTALLAASALVLPSRPLAALQSVSCLRRALVSTEKTQRDNVSFRPGYPEAVNMRDRFPNDGTKSKMQHGMLQAVYSLCSTCLLSLSWW